jgi:CBS domain-containing protein
MSTDIISLKPDDSIFDAAKLFSKLDVHGLPVVKNQKIVGIITVTDIIRFIDIKIDDLPELKGSGLANIILTIFKTLKSTESFEKEMQKISNTKVEDIMTKELVTINRNTNFIRIAKLMDQNKIHRLPVVSRKKLVGMVNGVDLMKVLMKPPGKKKKRKIPKKTKKK